jgi:hypothetical protein|tara:strand:- start:32219 stop:32482 length:264 start_codon:yes stop_codon:yes gene_type:complete
VKTEIEPDKRKWDHNGEKPIRIACSKCGSFDVRRDAYVEWDIEKQKWVLATVFDDGACMDCEDSASLIEIQIEDAEIQESSDEHEPG